MQTFSPVEGLLIIAGYAALTTGVGWIFSRGFRYSKDGFLLAERKIRTLPAAMSIAATWIWAPALFVSAEKAYTQGWVGLFWFWVPNVLCLIIFGLFATHAIRVLIPRGFTPSAYMGERYSKRVQNMYLFALIGLSTGSFTLQLVAGGGIISAISGLPYFWVTVILALIPIGYSLRGGLRASVASDFLQMIIMLLGGGGIVLWAVWAAGGTDIVWAGFFGKNGTHDSLFSDDGLRVFLTFGLPATIGLLAGPFGDQTFWQRAFAVKGSVRAAFTWGAILFGLVPLIMSVLGFLAAGMGLSLKNPAHVNMEVIRRLLPVWAMMPFVYILLAGLVSTLDSQLSAVSSLMGHDVLERMGKDSERRGTMLLYARSAMVMLIAAGIALANIPGMTILYIFLFNGTLRSSTLLPTVITILKTRVSEAGMFWGIIVSLSIGLPIFAYGNLYKIVPLIVGGSLFTVLASGVIVLLASARMRTRVSAVL